MKFNKIAAFLLAAVCAASCVSCEKEKSADKENISQIIENIGENEAGELITPAEDSEEYELGAYRYSSNGVKLYAGDDTVTTDVLLALEKYFLTIQNNDFEGYKNSLYPDYAERYDKYLREEYSKTVGKDYSLQNSFEMRYNMIRDDVKDMLTYESDEEKEFTGDYKITRIRVEKPIYEEGVTEETLIQSFFDSYKDIFDIDYSEFVKNDVDSLMPFTLFVMAETEDGNEHKIISEVNIILAEKDGKYYTFG